MIPNQIWQLDIFILQKYAKHNKGFKNIIFNRRHLKVHIVCLLQSFISCPKEIRKLVTNVFMFKPSKVEFENFASELFETKKRSSNRTNEFCI